jgi:hypothetical protein
LFDVSAVDRKSVRLGGANPLGQGRGPHRPPDVDGDGWRDLLLAFRARHIEFKDDCALLTGQTRESVPIEARVSFERRGRKPCDWDDIELGDPEALAGAEADSESEGETPGALRIERLTPNPSAGASVLEFRLPSAATASLDVLDVAGRRVWSRSLAGSTPGVHRIDMGQRRFSPGVYLVVLSQGTARVSTPWAVVR